PRAIPPETVSNSSELLQWQELSPAPEPVEALESLSGLPHLLFLDSALRHPQVGRYSYLTGDPFEWIWSTGPYTHVSNEPAPPAEADPFPILAERLRLWRTEP